MAADKQATTRAGTPAKQTFSQMSTAGKMKHVAKIFVFVITFGFAFPGLFSD